MCLFSRAPGGTPLGSEVPVGVLDVCPVAVLRKSGLSCPPDCVRGDSGRRAFWNVGVRRDP
jgi:hypothetical protein